MTGTVDLHRNVGLHLWREYLAGVRRRELGPKVRAVPRDNMIGIIPADEPVVRDVKIARSGVVRINAHADILEPASLYSQSLGSNDELCSGPNRDFRVPNRQTFEVVVI